ncbi:MAG: ATP-binding protein, partial [Verrucomicrobia bacterium]|nr:ATP-binding protein [Verrucomicrobiota bacterium]
LYHGSLEYFLPHLHVQGVTAHELEDLYATKVVPVIDRILPRSPTAPSALCAAANPPKIQEVVLGRTREAAPREVTLRLTELIRHTAVLGGSGIGKTTLACSLVEQVLILGVPVVLLDRKGDLSRYADPAAWQPQSVPPEQSARLSELRDALRIDLYTPGVSSARPLGIDLIPADAALLTEEERTQAAREAATGLGSMMGLADRPGDQPRIAVLARAVQLLVEQKSAVTLSSLIDVLRASPESLERAVGALDLQRHGRKLVERLQTLEIMKGELFNTGQEMLRVENLLRRPDRGKARLTVINTQGLNEATFFWLAQFLSALGRFAKSHPSAQLQLLVMIDEADRYLPANSVPITKPPLENLLRRGRSAGIGLLLATQSPGDLDYRCRENVRTWLVGLVKQNTALEKLKPMFPQEGREALDAVSKQRVGQFCLVADGQVTSFEATPNLIKTEQLPEGRVHELAAKAFDRPG